MAAVDVGVRDAPPVPGADDLDDLFNYDVGDAFRDVDTKIDASAVPKPTENAAGLGIDEEIKVKKKRAPVPKLDENRLLGSAGIPKLRRITKDHLRFKGKGHEHSDVTRLLNVFQLWLDELYPRAKFADGLALIEKLGHTKRMQTMRREWIKEEKPRERSEDLERVASKESSMQSNSELGSEDPFNSKHMPSSIRPTEVENKFDLATPEPTNEQAYPSCRPDFEEDLFISDGENLGDLPPDDDLDALLKEDMTKAATTDNAPVSGIDSTRTYDDFDDDMEAMASMDARRYRSLTLTAAGDGEITLFERLGQHSFMRYIF